MYPWSHKDGSNWLCWSPNQLRSKCLSLTSHCPLTPGVGEVRTLCPQERDANGENPNGPGYQGGAVWSRWNLNEQLLQRMWANRAPPCSSEELRLKATPIKRPFLWKESSTASVEKDWGIQTVEIRKCFIPKGNKWQKNPRAETKGFLQHNSQWYLPLRTVLRSLPSSHLRLFYHSCHMQRRLCLHLVQEEKKTKQKPLEFN